MSRPVPVLVTYRPKKGRESRFLAILRRHWPALRSAGLADPAPPRVWRATDKRSGRRYFVESFAWKDGRASARAHSDPEVLAVWGPMEPLLESMEIAVVEEVRLRPAAAAPARRRERRIRVRPLTGVAPRRGAR